MNVDGFVYDAANTRATWSVHSGLLFLNERFRAVLSGVYDFKFAPMPGGDYINEFTVLSGDVSGDNAVSPNDSLVLINHLNGPDPVCDPVLDVNGNGAITPTDTLLIINRLDETGSYSLVAPGAFGPVAGSDPPSLHINGIRIQDGLVTLFFDSLIPGSLCKVEKAALPGDTGWLDVVGFSVSSGMNQISFAAPGATTIRQFYRASAR